MTERAEERAADERAELAQLLDVAADNEHRSRRASVR